MQGIFQKSVYRRGDVIRYLVAWRVYAIFKKMQQMFEKSVYARELESGIIGPCSAYTLLSK